MKLAMVDCSLSHLLYSYSPSLTESQSRICTTGSLLPILLRLKSALLHVKLRPPLLGGLIFRLKHNLSGAIKAR